MKITRLPSEIDPARMIEERITEKFKICPFCGETRDSDKCLLDSIKRGESIKDSLWGGVEKINYVPPKGWYGPAKGDILGNFIPSRYHHWRIDCYRCHTCGAEWESDPYPTDITGLKA